MKQCPVCKTTYTDETLRFCLADGAGLVSLTEAEKTIQMSFGNEPVRVDTPDSVPTVFPPANSVVSSARKGFGLIVIVLFSCFLLLGIAGFAAFMLLKPKSDKIVSVTNASPSLTPIVLPSATQTNETIALKEKLANLEKQVEAQKNQKQITPEKPSPPIDQTIKIARVNSPGDGFLALRSEPDSETGERLAKIPHGATVTVLGCPKPSNVGKMAGHWCQVIYNGQAGWAFDAFLIY